MTKEIANQGGTIAGNTPVCAHFNQRTDKCKSISAFAMHFEL